MTLIEEELLGAYLPLNGVRLNMVINADGDAKGLSNTSNDLSNLLDRKLLKHLRKLSKVVVTDAATAAAEQYKPSRFVDIEVWSRSANFRGLEQRRANDGFHEFRTEEISDEGARLNFLIETYGQVLLESGPTLTSVFARKLLVDEACLTVTAAASEDQALLALKAFAKSIGVDYLKLRSWQWIDGTLFATLTR